MKRLLWAASVLATASLCLFGCKKKQAPPSAAPVTINGISVDLPQLRLTITNHEAAGYLGDIETCFRYEDYRRAQEDIEKVANDPGLTDEQKAAAAKVVEQIKQVRASATSGIR